MVIFSQLGQDWNIAAVYALIKTVGEEEFILSCILIVALYVADCVAERKDLWMSLKRRCLPARWAVYYATLLAIILFGVYGKAGTFIYFQF